MTLKNISVADVHKLRDSIEDELLTVMNAAFKTWLAQIRKMAVKAAESGSPNVLLAASTEDEMPGLGTVASLWAAEVDRAVVLAVRAALVRAYGRWTDQSIESSRAMEATNAYIASVRDRLVRGERFGVTVYEESFNRIRASLAAAAAEGWTRRELAQRIANELAWEKNGAYWRGQLAQVEKKIDDILDPLGDPGSPLREQARRTDPFVKALQADRSRLVKLLDEERSTWQTRAHLIARTEATGAANYGAYQALIFEGVATKVWVATGDGRTRATHAAASGEEVPIDGMFQVGNALLRFPGDPNGPVEEIANCRCAMIGG